MAYDKDAIFEQAKQVITKNNLFFASDIIAYLPICESTFYSFFPPNSKELEILKKMLEDNRVKTKSGIRRKLYDGKGTDLIALYKMICTDEERRALSLTYQENKQEITGQMVIVTADEMEKDALKKMKDED